MSVNGWVDSDIVPLLWAAFIEHVDWGTKAEQTDQLIIKVINVKILFLVVIFYF